MTSFGVVSKEIAHSTQNRLLYLIFQKLLKMENYFCGFAAHGALQVKLVYKNMRLRRPSSLGFFYTLFIITNVNLLDCSNY